MYSPLTEESTDVEFFDRARLLVIKFIEAVPTKGIPAVGFSSHIRSLPLYQPDSCDNNGYEFS